MMEGVKVYIRLHWNALASLAAGILLCSITSTFTVPYVFRQWESDRGISVMRVSAGVLLGIAGITILALLTRKHLRKKESWIKRLLILVIMYLLIQLVASTIWGSIGIFSYYQAGMSYGNSQTIMDICIAIWQNLIRVFFLYLIITWKNSVDWRSRIKDYKMTFLVAACLAAIPILLNTFEYDLFAKVIGLVWTCIFIVSFVIVFDSTMRGMKR